MIQQDNFVCLYYRQGMNCFPMQQTLFYKIWMAKPFPSVFVLECVLTCATGIDRSQNGSNTVERNPQTVQVTELFSCPTNRSKGRNNRWKINLNLTCLEIQGWYKGNYAAHEGKSLTHYFAVLPLQVHIPHPLAFFLIPVNETIQYSVLLPKLLKAIKKLKCVSFN